MSNTRIRVISALVLVAILSTTIYLGPNYFIAFMGLTALFIIDEVFVNFFKLQRVGVDYFLALLLFFIPFVFFNYIYIFPHMNSFFTNGALIINFFLMAYLFSNNAGIFFDFFTKKRPFLCSLFFLFPIMSLSSLLLRVEWLKYFVTLFFINFGMDTGAWFFGKLFGKHKLWEKISPKKTVEGLVGGMFVSALVGSISWYFFFSWKEGPLIILVFLILGLLSQLGDLVQSKLKRAFNVKDSSQLIPGHGGIYDRVDSILFMAPFFVGFLNLLLN